MKYRYLGESGLLVSRVCLGTMTFGTEGWGCDQQAADEITHLFLDSGGNFIDTADMYAHGQSEEMLGKALRSHDRDDLVLATKCWFRMRSTPNAKGLSRKHILEAVEASLKRLNTDYIDLYQVHGPDPFTPLEETMKTLDDLVRSGKVRYIGCSNFHGWQIAKANGISDRLGLYRFVGGQYMYNLLRRDTERDILPACADAGMGVLCWSPLAGGMLTGKYNRDDGPAEGSRVDLRAATDLPRYWNEQSFQVIDELKSVAREIDKSPGQVALAWLLKDRRITSIIVGAKSSSQLTDNLLVADWDLSDSLYQRLSDVVPFSLGYPNDWATLSRSNIAGDEEF